MIWESAYWKNDLLRLTRILKQKQHQKIWRESSEAIVEKAVMTGFYIIRKLMEAKKLSDTIVYQKIPVRSHQHCGKPVTLMNWHHIDRHYDFAHRHLTQRSLTWLCNQMIHSYIFILSLDDKNGLDGLYFASERERNKAIHYLSLEKVIKVFGTTGTNYPWRSRSIFNSKTQDYDVHQD